MKRIIAFLLACIFCLSLVSCLPEEETENEKIYDREVVADAFLKERISEATAIYYKSSADGACSAEDVFEVSVMPAGYTELSYVQTNGTQYIDTGVAYRDGLVFDGKIGEYKKTVGSVFSTSSYCFSLLPADTSIVFVSDSERFPYTDFSAFKTYSFHCDKNSFTVNGVNTAPQPENVEEGGGNVYLFKYKNGNATVKLYALKISDGAGTVLRNFIPAKRDADGEVGLYDLVQKKFYTAESTAYGFAGGEIKTGVLPAYVTAYDAVEYVELSGSQYVDTGIVPNAETNLEIGVAVTENAFARNAENPILGVKNGENGLELRAIAEGKDGTPVWQVQNGNKAKEVLAVTENRKINLKITKGSVKDVTDTLTLGASRCDGEVVCADGIRLYGCKIYDGETLLADFVPVFRKSDGVCGLYDLVTETFSEGECAKRAAVTATDGCAPDEANRYFRFPASVHFDGYTYFNLTKSGENFAVTYDISFDASTGVSARMGGASPIGVNADGACYFGKNTELRAGTRITFTDAYGEAHTVSQNGEVLFTDAVTTDTYTVGALADGTYGAAFSLYGLTVEADGDTVAAYRPAERKSDGALGLFDTVTGTFILVESAENKFGTGAVTGHDFGTGKTVTEATESHAGEVVYTCRICGKQVSEEAAALAYTVRITAKDEGVLRVRVFDGFDFSSSTETDVAYTRNEKTNNFSKSGASVYFEIELADGYLLDEVDADTAKVKQVKKDGDEKLKDRLIYQVTGITGDLEIFLYTAAPKDKTIIPFKSKLDLDVDKFEKLK